MDMPLDLPLIQRMERPELAPEFDDDFLLLRQKDDIPIDPALLEDDDEPYNPPNTPRPPARWPRFDPVDDALRSQGHAGRTYPVARMPRPELAPVCGIPVPLIHKPDHYRRSHHGVGGLKALVQMGIKGKGVLGVSATRGTRGWRRREAWCVRVKQGRVLTMRMRWDRVAASRTLH